MQPILVDNRNFEQMQERIRQEVSSASLIGFDIETEDSNRHDGLNRYMKVSDDGHSKTGKLVFDTRRTTVTGFSLYPDESEHAYYINLAHADIENRLSWQKAQTLLDAKEDNKGYWVCHNAPFELVMMQNSLGYYLNDVICTLQMAVSAYGPDNYDLSDLRKANLGEINKLIPAAARAFASFDPNKRDMDTRQAEVFSQVVGKTSRAKHSYNGLIDSISFGYGLKQAVKTWFGHQMTTFEETLGNKPHMGCLTGEEVVNYGADDAYWAVRLFHRLLEYMMKTNPKVWETYLEQELPMVPIYAESWRTGLRINYPSIAERQTIERANIAESLRVMKEAVRQLLPFDTQPHQELFEKESWYKKGHQKYRTAIEKWANEPNTDDDFEQVSQVRGPITNGWRSELKKPESTGPNFSHYMPVRTLMYDLMREPCVMYKGKVQSDADARGRMKDRIAHKENDPLQEAKVQIFTSLQEIAGAEQRMKLYLTPYSMLADPETECVYPVLSSKLASRRMATAFPNPMQLAKRGDSTYVRGFYLPDTDDELIVSIDWSGVELVLIGDMSGDPEFYKAFGQLPYGDLHSGAAADVLGVDEDDFLSLKGYGGPVDKLPVSLRDLLVDLKGQSMSPEKAFKYWRTEVGKGANFNYWYSGALSTVGERLGWTPDRMFDATEAYRNRFSVAEEWRKEVINDAIRNGYVTLPDGHRRERLECTEHWANIMKTGFGWHLYNDQPDRMPADVFNASGEEPVVKFGRMVINTIQRRAKNQIVNSLIQGTCATLAKRSIVRVVEQIKAQGFRARFMLPVHDELVFSVHKDEVVEFIRMAKRVMLHHPDIVPNLPLDASASVGRTFEPYDGKSVLYGQIELDEAPKVDWLPEEKWGKKLNDEEIKRVVQYLTAS